MIQSLRFMFTTLVCGFLLATHVMAQTQAPAPQPTTKPEQPAARPTPPPMPPDRKAYMEATTQKDPEKKIAALQKFIADFPDSSGVSSANQTILTTLVQKFPDQKDRIAAQIQQVLEKTPEYAKSFTYSQIAATLLDAGLMLEKAEEIATKGLSLTEEEIIKSSKQRRAPYQASLGRIYLKQGKLSQAEKYLKQAQANDPRSGVVALGLAELAEKKKDDKLALDSYVTALALGGRLPDDTRQKAEALFSKAHNSSTKGFEELIDAKYNKLNAPPFTVAHYTPSPKRSNRLVLGEVFTGAACGPCVAADLAFDLMMERYKRDDFIVLMYHLHIPGPDPMTNPATVARGKFYTVQGVPSYAVDGNMPSAGGGSRDNTKYVYDRVNPMVEKRLELAADAELKLEAVLEGNVIKTRALLDKFKGEAANLKLQIVLAEEKIRYSGENGIRFHPMVVRSIAGEKAGGFTVAAQGATKADWSFDVPSIATEHKKYLDEYEAKPERGDPFKFREKKHEIDTNNLTVVAFVQDEKTKAILQTATVKIKRAIAENTK